MEQSDVSLFQVELALSVDAFSLRLEGIARDAYPAVILISRIMQKTKSTMHNNTYKQNLQKSQQKMLKLNLSLLFTFYLNDYHSSCFFLIHM